MRLINIAIDGFKTFATPGQLALDPSITTLVGANESGKTNLLESVEYLSQKLELKKQHICKADSERCTQKRLPCLTYTFSLSNEEQATISKVIPEFSETSLTIKRSGNGLSSYSLSLPEEKVIQNLNLIKDEYQHDKNAVESQLKNAVHEMEKIESESSSLKRGHGDVIPPKNIETLKKLETRYRQLDPERIKLTNELSFIESNITAINEKILSSKKGENYFRESQIEAILKLLPQVIYINKLEPFPENIPIEVIKLQSSPQASLIGNLLKIGGFYDYSELDTDYRQLNRALKSTSERITARFQQFWTQEDVEFKIEKQAKELAFSIEGGISVTSSPLERSAGFQWLLAFFSQFALQSEKNRKDVIILLDEPAIDLHPRGQKDVLKLIEEIGHKYQVIYSTHSPFMINKNFPHRLRLLTKELDKGTIINNKPYSDSKSRFWEPLKSAIGISLGDLLSLGEANLIVEGVSDQIIIIGISQKFADLGLPFIDLERTSVVPAMGATCEESLARFALSAKLKTISLLDNDSEGKRILKKLKDEKGIKLLTVDSLEKAAITIEDLVPQDLYIRALNSVYSHFDDYKDFIIDDGPGVVGVLSKICKHMKAINFELDKVAVARELVRLLDINKENLSRYQSFLQLFTIVNDLQNSINL